MRIDHEPEVDFAATAGHYDEANLVWSFSGELDGIMGLTESYQPPPETARPAHRTEEEP